MDGLPGPYIKYFLTTLGHAGLNTMLDGFPTRNAWALCTFAYSAGPGKRYTSRNVFLLTNTFEGTEPTLFEGRTDGTIVQARGPGHFGWDAVFEPHDTGLT